jgi:hypothetical protein
LSEFLSDRAGPACPGPPFPHLAVSDVSEVCTELAFPDILFDIDGAHWSHLDRFWPSWPDDRCGHLPAVPSRHVRPRERVEDPHVHEAPIYAQLISERGDIPTLVRSEARRLQRDFEWILSWDPSTGAPLPASAARLASDARRSFSPGPDPDDRLDSTGR